MKKNLILFLLISFVLASCGSKKRATDHISLKNATARKVIKTHERTNPDFKTLSGRLKGTYDDGYESQSISVSIRMKKDETIWVSAKLAGIIPMAKLMVTPEKVLFYEKINNQYFDGDFCLLSKWLGTEIDFEKLQNLLLGEAVFELKKNAFVLIEKEEGYQLINQSQEKSENVLIDKSTFRIINQQMISTENQEGISIDYPKYKRLNHFYFPDKIDIIVDKNDGNAEINIDYRSLEINKSVKFPFEMPFNYKEIQIK